MTQSTPDELQAVLLGAVDGVATDQELAWLNETLRNDPQARRRASVFLMDESLLADTADAERTAKDLVDRLSRPSADEPATPRSRWGLISLINRHGLVVASLAATLLVALAVQNFMILRQLDRAHAIAMLDPPEAAGRPRGGRGDSVGAVVGRVSGLERVVWDDGQQPLAFGDSISEGSSLRVASGVVELLLSTGAKVTVEGPARFDANTVSESELSHGKIAAAVPRAARGYTILTPTSEVVDIGTQFGVSVDERGDSELHVFQGDVVARSRLEGASPNLLHARQDEAMRFSSRSDTPSRFDARQADFVRRVGPAFGSAELPELPVNRGLSLWYAADVTPGYGVGDRVATWRDLLIGDNRYADDAWQFDEHRRPTLVADEAGRPALRFDGWSTFLATSPLESGNRQTIAVVYAPGPTSFANEHHGGILFKYRAAPSLELAVFKDRSARGWVWPGPGAAENVGVVRSEPVDAPGINVLLYQYNAEERIAELWHNGSSQGSAGATLPIGKVTRCYLGAHHEPHLEASFFGNLYEVVVFEEKLDAASRRDLEDYFAARYRISPPG